jgi:hypothetical protein
MNVFRCQKTPIKNPPALFFASVVLAIFAHGGDLLLQHLINSGIVGACRTGALYPLFMLVFNKFLVFCYYVEAMHALRACKSCAQETCNILNRWRHDFVWLVFLVFLLLGTFAEIVHVIVARQAAQFLPMNSCRVTQSTALVAHHLIWTGTFTLILTLGFMCLGLCTVGHYPVLNDVSRWQYILRTWLFKIMPPCAKHATNEEFGADQPVKCPAYLVPLNGRTAGISEHSAFQTVLTVVLTMIPTATNMGLLIAFEGKEQTWLFFLICNLDSNISVL